MDVADASYPDYHSYILRLWGNAAQGVWHSSLQSTATKQTIHFASLEALVAFLVTQLAAQEESTGAGEPTSEDGTH